MSVRFVFLPLVCAVAISAIAQPSFAQSSDVSTSSLPALAAAGVPPLVPYSGEAVTADGKALAGETSVSFLIYKDESGGEPLFVETQTVVPDAAGRYKVQLGATLASGLPVDLFSTGEARWLEVQIAGQPPQRRTLLASVPYALKAADAATLGGLPASAFVLARPTSADLAVSQGITPAATGNVTTTGGVSGYVPEFSGVNSIVDSPLFVSGTSVGVGTTTPTATLDVNGSGLFTGGLAVNGVSTLNGFLLLPALGTATTSTSYNSQYFKLVTSAYNSSTKAIVAPRFQLQAEVAGNDTANPTGTLNLIASNGPASPTETGFYINANGTIHFAPGQTFPGGTGTGTITGVAAGTGLTGGGTSGNVTLNVDTGAIPTLGGNNSFTGSDVFTASLYENVDVNIDNTNANSGNISPGLRFGSASGEGMSSQRTSGSANQYGLDLYTDYSARMSITASGQVGINVSAAALKPAAGAGQLSVAGTGGLGGIWASGGASGGNGVYGITNDTNTADDVAGVYGFSSSDLPGLEGTNYTGTGNGFSAFANGPGILGVAGQAYYESNDGPGYAAGVKGTSYRYVGVYGTSGLLAGVTGESPEVGVFGDSSSGDGIYGNGGTGDNEPLSGPPAGYFNGNVEVASTLTASVKDFKIDHPSDPANKYLYHTSVESSEMLDIYSGNVTTDELGIATIALPSWFETLNTDFRYQLTTIGRDAHTWVAQKVHDGKFQIATNASRVEVSWQITAVRQDPYAKAHPLVVEQEKPTRERGFYLHPELYGQPDEKQLSWARHPTMMAAKRARQEAQKSRAVAPQSGPDGKSIDAPGRTAIAPAAVAQAPVQP